MQLKKISLLGSTGSIGRQTLDIVGAHEDRLSIVALAAGSNNLNVLADQIRRFKPELVCVPREDDIKELKRLLGSASSSSSTSAPASASSSSSAHLSLSSIEFVHGARGLETAAAETGADTVVTGIVGFLGLKPTAEAVKKGKTIALANKETLVAAGSAIMPMVKEHNARIVPVDSEHSAIFQSIAGHTVHDVEKIWLTASGGPFRTWKKEQIENATRDDALKHPNWSMGPKITIDSATLMNKGLEIIEARWLFDLPAERIKVVIHPQSILHSAVEFVDGSIVGQMGLPDMRLPIHYALFHPERVSSDRVPRLDLSSLSALTFEEPDTERFPCLGLAARAAADDSTTSCVLNAANEVIVQAFLEGRIRFVEIPVFIERVIERHKAVSKPSLDDILVADRWARQEADQLLKVGAS